MFGKDGMGPCGPGTGPVRGGSDYRGPVNDRPGGGCAKPVPPPPPPPPRPCICELFGDNFGCTLGIALAIWFGLSQCCGNGPGRGSHGPKTKGHGC